MDYKKKTTSDSLFMLDGEVTLEQAVESVSKLTGVSKKVLLEGSEKHTFIKIIEDPSLLDISPDEEQSINEIREILDYTTGVDF